MSNPYFRFKQFTVHHDRCAMKVTTDACLFGAWCAREMESVKWSMKNVLDIGAGTGLLSLMIAQKNDVIIDAIEIDSEAAAQATENAARSPFRNINIINNDVLQFVPAKGYDVIISNPPFYEDELPSGNEQKNTAHHSSQLKLTGLFKKIDAILSPGGSFFLLLPYKRKSEIEKALQHHSLYVWKEMIVRQTEDHTPFRWMIQGGKTKPGEIEHTEMLIKENGVYSKAFVDLLQAYYLYL